jgi:hypothetical protein
VVVFGDHGEGLGDHQETDHGYYIYESTLHVPLIVHWPGKARNSAGNWQLEIGNWKSETGNPKFAARLGLGLRSRNEKPGASSQFPVSSFGLNARRPD